LCQAKLGTNIGNVENITAFLQDKMVKSIVASIEAVEDGAQLDRNF